ncbi:hypothetical protein O6H91_Y232400 [Diphasiastrum complanatum]|nr:hypothetical protein O6H91_Y232400 [Diphasiastrum complanatum]
MGNHAKSSKHSMSTTPLIADDGKSGGKQKLQLTNPPLRGSKSPSRVSKRQRSSRGSGSSAQTSLSKSPSPNGANAFSRYSLSSEYEQLKKADISSDARTGTDGAMETFLVSQERRAHTQEAFLLVKNVQHSSDYLALLELFNQFQGKRVDYNKVLVTVTVLGTIGPLRMLLEGDTAVNNVIKATLDEYAREGRLPFIGFDCTRFELHLSQFSLQAIPRHACIKDLGTRSFVLCASNCKRVPFQIPRTPCSFQVTRPWWSVLVNVSFS